MALGILPLLGLFILVASKKTLMKRVVRKRIGAMYEDLSIEVRSRRVLVLMYFLRRILIMVLIMEASHLPGIQLQVQLYVDLLLLIHMGVIKPYKFRSYNRLGLFSEMTILCITSFMVIYTEFCTLPWAQYNVSWFFIASILFYVLISFINMLRRPVKAMSLRLVKYSKIIKFKTRCCWGPFFTKSKLVENI
jgi:hypothetical protein